MDLKRKCLFAKDCCLKKRSRVETINLLMVEFSIGYNSARNIVYNYLWEYNWVKSDYPKNRKKRYKKIKIQIDPHFKTSKKSNISNISKNSDFTF